MSKRALWHRKARPGSSGGRVPFLAIPRRALHLIVLEPPPAVVHVVLDLACTQSVSGRKGAPRRESSLHDAGVYIYMYTHTNYVNIYVQMYVSLWVGVVWNRCPLQNPRTNLGDLQVIGVSCGCFFPIRHYTLTVMPLRVSKTLEGCLCEPRPLQEPSRSAQTFLGRYSSACVRQKKCLREPARAGIS